MHNPAAYYSLIMGEKGLKKYIIGVDLGTNGLKVALFDIDGTVVKENYQETSIKSTGPGFMEQDPDDYYDGTIQNIKDFVQSGTIDPKEVLAIGFTGQMGGIVGVDEEYNPVTPYDIVLDTRSQKYVNHLKTEYERSIFEFAQGSFSHASKMLWWKKENNEVYKKICKFVTLAPYVAGRMAGLRGDQAYIDYTSLFDSGLTVSNNLSWSEDICDLFGIDRDRLPDIVQPWKIIGKLDSDNARYCGLREGTPLVAGAGDQPAGFLAAGIVYPGMAIDVSGSTSIFSVCTDTYIPDLKHKRIIYLNAVLPGIYYATTLVSGGGIALRWFRDHFAQNEKSQSEEEGNSAFHLLDEKAASIETGSGALLFIPHLGGRVCPSVPEVRGAWLGLNWGHNHVHLYRSILESIAYDHATTLAGFKRMFPSVHIEGVRVTGGGAKSTLWNQIKSDVLNIPCIRLNKKEFALFGAALIAGHALGVYPDLRETVNTMVTETIRTKPNLDNHSIYTRFVHEYERFIDTITPICRVLTDMTP